MFCVRSHAVDVPQRGTPAELKLTWLGTRVVPLLDPELDPEPLLDPVPDPDELEPPELDPLEVEPSPSSSPDKGPPLLLLLHACTSTEATTAIAQGPIPRSHGYRREAMGRAVM